MNRPKPRKFWVLRRALHYLSLLKEMQRSLLVLVKVDERTCILREAEMVGRSNHHKRLIKHKKNFVFKLLPGVCHFICILWFHAFVLRFSSAIASQPKVKPGKSVNVSPIF